MIGAGVGAGNIGVQCFDFVGKSIGGKKIQSAIGDGGLTAKSTRIKPREDVIGPQGAMFRNKNFQRATADRVPSGAIVSMNSSRLANSSAIDWT